MRKSMFFGSALLVAIAFTGCKSSESAYKKAYERAKVQAATVTPEESQAPSNNTVETAPVTDNREQESYDNEPVRHENVAVVSGNGLKAFSVVVGSFSIKANADGLQSRLKSAGYDAQVVYNGSNRMYRVVASSFNDKASAVQSRNQLRSSYHDAWLLAN